MGTTNATTDKKATTKKSAAEPDASGGGMPGLGDLERVRSILIGSHSRETERRLAKVESHFERVIETMREAFDKRLEGLETFAKEEMNAASRRLGTETEQRTASYDQLSGQLGDLKKALADHRAQLDERIAESERDLRARILDQSKSLSDDLRQKAEALTAMTEEHVESLRTDKADRLALAELFDGLALRLRDDVAGPEEL